MATNSYVYDPARRIISVQDARLNRMLVRDSFRYATLTEYATGAGLPTERVVALLGTFLDDGTLGLEVADGEIFLLTAPAGRPIADQRADVAPNLWEALRATSTVADASQLWRIIRSMERAGWDVEPVQTRVADGLGPVSKPAKLGFIAGRVTVPLIVWPSAEELAAPTGILAEYDRAGASAVGVLYPQGGLDTAVTSARRYMLARRSLPTAMSVIVLEAPRYQPVMLTVTDSAVTPRTLDRQLLEQSITRS